MSNTKENIYGITGTIVFHALLVLVILLLALRTPLPLPAEQGVEVDLGYTDQGTGDQQPVEEAAASVPPAASHKSSAPEQENLTQETEEAPPVEAVKPHDKTVKPEDKNKDKVKTVAVKKEDVKKEEVKQPVINPDALYKGRKTESTATGSEGQTGNPGDQGVPMGNPGVKNYEGIGGLGEGISFSLGGRQSKLLPKPEYRSEEQGKVVVTIWVNRIGDVIRAEPGAKGTDITDLSLRQLAKEAALKSKFTPDPGAPEEQKGTITYKFIKMN